MAFLNGARKPLTNQLALKGGVEAKTLTGNLTLDEFSANFLEIDPGGSARTVTLPAADGKFNGVIFGIYNAADAAEAITIANAAATTIIILQRGESAIVGSDGSGWQIVSATAVGGSDFGSVGISADVIAESTSATGVTVDGLLIKDGDALFVDSDKAIFGTGSDVSVAWDGTDLDMTAAADDSVFKIGTGTVSFDIWLYGNATSTYVSWDASADSLKLEDNVFLGFGTNTAGPGTKGDINIAWNGTKLLVAQTTANSAIDWGVDGAGIDHVFYGDTANANLTWDQSADKLIVNGAASVQGLRTSSSSAAAITEARVLTLADSGGVFSVSQAAAYDIDLPDPTTGPGCRYTFYLTGAAANNVTISVTGAATFVGTIVNDVTSVVVATGNTLTFASGTAALGDNIEIVSISTSLYLVRAVSSAAGGITVA